MISLLDLLHRRFPWAKCESSPLLSPIEFRYRGSGKVDGLNGDYAKFAITMSGTADRSATCASMDVNKIEVHVGESAAGSHCMHVCIIFSFD